MCFGFSSFSLMILMKSFSKTAGWNKPCCTNKVWTLPSLMAFEISFTSLKNLPVPTAWSSSCLRLLFCFSISALIIGQASLTMIAAFSSSLLPFILISKMLSFSSAIFRYSWKLASSVQISTGSAFSFRTLFTSLSTRLKNSLVKLVCRAAKVDSSPGLVLKPLFSSGKTSVNSCTSSSFIACNNRTFCWLNTST